MSRLRRQAGAPRFAAVIPVRDGAGRFASVALADLGGRAVLDYSVDAAREAAVVERVLVASGDEAVRRWCRRQGVEFVALPPHLGRPEVTAETVLLHVLADLEREGHAPDHLLLLAPQLPLRRAGRVAAACDLVSRDEADSVMSVCPVAPYLWRPSPAGLIPFYDPQARPPRAAASPSWLRENGSLYVVTSRGLVEAGQRMGGRLGVVEMDAIESVRADEPAGLDVCRALLAHVRPERAPAALTCRNL